MGLRKAVSLGGSVTGHGANILIIDDLMKAEDACSVTERQRVKEFCEQTLFSRLNDKQNGAIIAIQQRLHEDDLAGYLLAKGTFTHLELRAIAEEDEEHALGNRRVHASAIHRGRNAKVPAVRLEKAPRIEFLRPTGVREFLLSPFQEPAEKGSGAGVLRRHEDGFGIARFQDDPLVYEQNPVRNIAGKAHFMRHDDHRHAFGRQLAHDLQDLAN